METSGVEQTWWSLSDNDIFSRSLHKIKKGLIKEKRRTNRGGIQNFAEGIKLPFIHKYFIRCIKLQTYKWNTITEGLL